MYFNHFKNLNETKQNKNIKLLLLLCKYMLKHELIFRLDFYIGIYYNYHNFIHKTYSFLLLHIFLIYIIYIFLKLFSRHKKKHIYSNIFKNSKIYLFYFFLRPEKYSISSRNNLFIFLFKFFNFVFMNICIIATLNKYYFKIFK